MDKFEQRDIVSEVKKSFIEYSMSVIISRALPDLRDGLKPVHRRILYTMYEDGLTPDKPFRKSATTVGAVLGRYHPHGDTSVYDAMVRMAQVFSYRYVLVDGHGNFGSIDGDGAAAYRYTEARLSKISLELLRDINKDTVDFLDNFDSTRKEPKILPSRFPNILVSGTMGIAVGMATNIPPHNLGEVIDGCVAYIDNPDITIDELMKYIKGPDFPTGATILGNSGIKKAYETGRGTITIRSKVDIVENNGKNQIVITELPYQVNKLELQKRIGELVRDKIIDGIADLHDESNVQNGVKVVITLKKDANANVVLNNLYKHTQLQTNFGIIFLMIDEMEPKILNLKEIIAKYINYQQVIIVRRTKFELEKSEKRVHILEGLKIALDNIDDVIKIIKSSKSDEIAKAQLSSKYGLDEVQSDAILEMKLRRLTGLERDKIENELAELLKLIQELKEILASGERILNIIKTELLEIKERYSDERRTSIDMTAIEYIEDESLIPVENCVITLTQKGYIKRMLSSVYKIQNRGGVGIKGMTTNEEDYVENIINVVSHDYVLFFTNYGKVYRMKGYEIPEYSRQSKGLPIINLLGLDKGEFVQALLKISNEEEYKYLVVATKKGIVKRLDISDFDSIRSNGKKFITLNDDDEIVSVKKTFGNNDILIASSSGKMIRFNETDVRVMGRSAFGVKGIDLSDDSIVVGMEIAEDDQMVLVVTENGYGKKTNISEYRITKRGGKGVKSLNITEKNGKIIAFKTVMDGYDLMLITNEGIVIRLDADKLPNLSRVTQGVKLINLKDSQKVSSIALIKKEDENSSDIEFNEEEIQTNVETN